MRLPSNPRNTITLLLFLVIILGLALLITILAAFVIKPAPEPLAAETEPDIVVDGRLVMERAEEFGVSNEFLQLILPGYLVYQRGGQYIYQPINYDLPQHSYDWSNLSYAPDRVYYYDENFPAVSYGVDVSTYQKEIDWAAAAADGIDFAIIRVGYRGYSEGQLFVDDRAAANLAGAAAAGLDIGVYVFSQAISVEEAEQEAQLALDAVDGYQITMPIVCDMEEIHGETARIDALTVEERSAIVDAFCKKIAEAGYTPMVYGNIRWLAGSLDLAQLADYPLWLAQYYDRPLFPYDFAIWQYTDSATVAGFSTGVDMNICFKRPWSPEESE